MCALCVDGVKGYELDINQWEPRAQLEELEAMDNWERLNGKTPKKKKVSHFLHASSWVLFYACVCLYA